MIEIKITTEQAKHLENFVEDHLMYCMQELDGLDPEEFPENWGAYGIYCGCTTCDTREHLMATFDWLRKNDVLDFYIED
jgi:hypothetical protein